MYYYMNALLYIGVCMCVYASCLLARARASARVCVYASTLAYTFHEYTFPIIIFTHRILS